MPYRRRVRSRLATVLLTAAVVLLPAAAPAVAAKAKPKLPDVTKSWATVNVCDTTAAPDTIGLRGSMPGLATKGTTMWMRFAVQYQTPAKRWKMASGLDTGYLSIGGSLVSSRQAGHSFKVKPPAAGGSFVLRGVVTFQWRKKSGTVISSAQRITTAGHQSTAGADPAGFSAATCTIT
jgi:hypothetical protein